MTKKTIALLFGFVALGSARGLRAQLTAEPTKGASAPVPSDSVTIKQYKAQRAEQEKEIAADQQQLADLKRQRAELESQLAIASATAAEGRANTLLMSDQVTALHGLDSLLTAAQNELTAQRDRLLGLSEVVGHHAAGQLVVLVRADSASGTPHLDSLRVLIDSAPSGARHYSPRANVALGEGAIDEIYRSRVLPTTHDVVVLTSVAGAAAPTTQSATVTVAAGSIVYVEFTLHGMQWTESSWTTTGAAP